MISREEFARFTASLEAILVFAGGVGGDLVIRRV